LAHLRADLRQASKSVLILGPWLDDYFAEQVVRSASKCLTVRVIVRPEEQMEDIAWERTMAALSVFDRHWNDFQARTLARLHAKCLSIDDRLLYVGSANWYRFSLEQGIEIVLRGPANLVDGGVAQLESIWDKAQPLEALIGEPETAIDEPEGITREVDDPLAAEVLRQNPKAFVLGKKRKSHD
jgi:hypothetical protein